MNEIPRLEWPTVKALAEEKLASLRKQNDSVELDAAQTAAVRGEIRALKWLLDLPVAVALKSHTPAPFPGAESF